VVESHRELPMNSEEVRSLVRKETQTIQPLERRLSFEKGLVEPTCEDRQYDTGSGSLMGQVWMVARLDEEVGIAYSATDFGATGCHWGLVLLEQPTFGSSGSWCRSLAALVEDSGYWQPKSRLPG